MADGTPAEGSGTTPPASPGLQNLKDQLELEKAKRDLAEYQAKEQLSLLKSQTDIIKEMIPSSELKAPEGTITVEGEKLGFINEQLAYLGMKKVAGDITALVKGKLKAEDHILILDKLTTAEDDLAYVEVQTQFELYKSFLENQLRVVRRLKPPVEYFIAPLLAAAIAPSVIGSMGTIAGFFKSDFTMKGLALDVQNEGLVTSVAGNLAKAGYDVYIINNYLMEKKFKDTEADKKSILSQLKGLYSNANALFLEKLGLTEDISKISRNLGAEDVPTLEARKKELEEKIAALQSQDPQRFHQEIDELEKRYEQTVGALDRKKWFNDASNAVRDAEAILSTFDTFMKGISTPEASQPNSKISSAILREEIRKRDITYLLYLKVLSSGGETITEKRFFWRSRFAYLSGVVVSCMLTTSEGKIVAADFFPILQRSDFDLSRVEGDIPAVRIVFKP